MQDLIFAKRRAMRLKPEKNWLKELSYQPEKLSAEALLDVLSKAMAEEINTTLKKRMYGVLLSSSANLLLLLE